tara:strand:+ start:103 stop:219 length:117 start_codon:yes stop_codon:yes gene_type:complete
MEKRKEKNQGKEGNSSLKAAEDNAEKSRQAELASIARK